MAASLPGDSAANNAGNPTLGPLVLFDLLSGPKGSVFGGRTLSWDANNHAVYTADATNLSTGGLSNGIGFGGWVIPTLSGLTAPQSIACYGFTDDYKPSISTPVPADAANAAYMYIGGGRSNADGTPNPYTAGFGIGAAGNGNARDAGAGPVFTGFQTKIVTAAGTIANGAAVETGFLNRTGVSVISGQSVLGVSNAASATVA